MYIAPNTYIRILKGVHLDLDHTHTINFTSKSAQFNYFNSKTKYELPKYSYQRHTKNSIKVQLKADDLYDCDYMMFQNTSHGDKIFYAFITNTEYINESTAIIEYKIDVIQTWLLDMEYEPCFIERTHTRTDEIGDNIQPEPVALGEYVISDKFGYKPLTPLQELTTIVMVTDTELALWCDKYDGVFSGCALYGFENNSQTYLKDITTFIKNYTDKGKPESIVAIYTCPKDMVKLGKESHVVISSDKNIRYPFKTEQLTVNDKLGGEANLNNTGYKPRNNKMYTYPYNFYHVDNGNGESLTLRYEYFKDLTPQFEARGTITMPVTVALNPVNYKNSTSFYLPETISLNNYPLCSWTVDAYQAWIAQNSTPLTLNAINQGASALSMVGRFPFSAPQVMANLAGSVGNVISQIYSASIQADICKGNTSSANVNVSSALQNFFGCRMSVNEDNAKTIDNYFTMFGYAVNKLDVPNRNNRSEYTYIKTIGCQLKGSFSEQDKQEIVDIHDKGITFWNNPDNVGNYSVTNTPRG